jgi:hypothetical protein
VGRGASCVYDPFRNPLVVEVSDLFAEVEILEQRRSPLAGLERMIGVWQADALGGGEEHSPPWAMLSGRSFNGSPVGLTGLGAA